MRWRVRGGTGNKIRGANACIPSKSSMKRDNERGSCTLLGRWSVTRAYFFDSITYVSASCGNLARDLGNYFCTESIIVLPTKKMRSFEMPSCSRFLRPLGSVTKQYCEN